MKVEGDVIHLDMPVRVPDFTLCLKGVSIRGISVNDVPLKQVSTRESFKSGTFLADDDSTLLAFDPQERHVTIKLSLEC